MYNISRRDQLDSITYNDGTSENFSYDGLGNPTTYRGKTLVWSNVNQLTSYNGNTFTYDGTGKRISKNSTTYVYADDKLIKEIRPNNVTISYLYGLDGIIGFKYGEDYYFYQKNLQGDVIEIIDRSGLTVANYTYDAWGNHKVLNPDGTENTDSSFIGNKNPIRYRSYYYDVETGLYYLKTRYYDPENARFISPDKTDYLDPQSFGGLNLYIYCLDNPVIHGKESVVFDGSSDILSISADESIGFNSKQCGNSSALFNNVIASGSFKNGLLFGKGILTGLYFSGNSRIQISLKNRKLILGTFGKFSLLNATGQIGVGNDIFNVSLVGVGDIGNISGMAGLLINPHKNTYFAGIEAKISVFSARGGVQFEIFNRIKNGKFYYKSGFALLFGFDFYIRIKFA